MEIEKILRYKKARKKRVFSVLLLVVAVIAGLYVGEQQQPSKEDPPSVSQSTIDTVQTKQYTNALAGLEALAVKGRAPKTGYTREQFGGGWQTGGGCDTRNRILARDLTNVLYQVNSCVVLRGTLSDPYTGRVIEFQRGQGTSGSIQIDHVVALSDAWQKGAQQLVPLLREQLANDGLNLLAADGSANQSKSDGDAATWLPPNKKIRCSYVARQVSVKLKYSLWVTAAEKTAIEKVLKTCPEQTLV